MFDSAAPIGRAAQPIVGDRVQAAYLGV